MSVLPDPTNAYNNGWEAGAKSERERIAERQAELDDCPPEYRGNNCIEPRHDCRKCWLDWLEADEIV